MRDNMREWKGSMRGVKGAVSESMMGYGSSVREDVML